MIGGSDTTTTFITAMLFFAFEKPKVIERLRTEINSVIKSDKDININNFKKLPYLECVIHETSRMMPPAAGIFTRIAT